MENYINNTMYTFLHSISIGAYIIAIIIVIYYALKIAYKFYLSSEPYRPSKIKMFVKRAIIGFTIFMILGFLFSIFSNNFAPQEPLNLNLITF